MSRAAPSASGSSTMKPFTLRPSASLMVPIDSDGGLALTNLPMADAD